MKLLAVTSILLAISADAFTGSGLPSKTASVGSTAQFAFSGFKMPTVGVKKPSKGKKVAQPVNFSDKTIVVEDMPGVLAPVGFFDPLNFAGKANDFYIQKYREAELTHGRVSMVAVVGFLVGEGVAGYTPLFDGKVTGAGISQISQVPGPFWVSFVAAAFAIETYRNQRAIVTPTGDVSRDSPEFGQYRADYIPGDLGFDPLSLKPEDPEEFKIMQTKELQHSRLAMLAAGGFLAQEGVDKQGIVEHSFNLVKDILPTF